MTEEIPVAQGRTLAVRFVLGTVIEQEGWTETRTTVKTQQGFVTQSGHVMGGSTTVNTIDIARQEVWVRHDDGREECINFFKNVIQTRAGHRVLIATGSRVGKPAWPLAVHKFNDGQTLNFVSHPDYLLTIGMRSRVGQTFLYLIAFGFMMTIVGIPISIILVVIFHFRDRALSKSISSQVLSRVKEIVQKELAVKQEMALADRASG